MSTLVIPASENLSFPAEQETQSHRFGVPRAHQADTSRPSVQECMQHEPEPQRRAFFEARLAARPRRTHGGAPVPSQEALPRCSLPSCTRHGRPKARRCNPGGWHKRCGHRYAIVGCLFQERVRSTVVDFAHVRLALSNVSEFHFASMAFSTEWSDLRYSNEYSFITCILQYFHSESAGAALWGERGARGATCVEDAIAAKPFHQPAGPKIGFRVLLESSTTSFGSAACAMRGVRRRFSGRNRW
jgi:hypothetical protein